MRLKFNAESAGVRRNMQIPKRELQDSGAKSFSLRTSAHLRALCVKVQVAICVALVAALTGRGEDRINYQEHVLPLIEANCSKCHNADKKKADLDLTSYQGALLGSGSGA